MKGILSHLINPVASLLSVCWVVNITNYLFFFSESLFTHYISYIYTWLHKYTKSFEIEWRLFFDSVAGKLLRRACVNQTTFCFLHCQWLDLISIIFIFVRYHSNYKVTADSRQWTKICVNKCMEDERQINYKIKCVWRRLSEVLDNKKDK